jgi:hypothetical protein
MVGDAHDSGVAVNLQPFVVFGVLDHEGAPCEFNWGHLIGVRSQLFALNACVDLIGI